MRAAIGTDGSQHIECAAPAPDGRSLSPAAQFPRGKIGRRRVQLRQKQHLSPQHISGAKQKSQIVVVLVSGEIGVVDGAPVVGVVVGGLPMVREIVPEAITGPPARERTWTAMSTVPLSIVGVTVVANTAGSPATFSAVTTSAGLAVAFVG